MTKAVEAVYEGGVLRPLEVLDLPERQRVRLLLETAPNLAGDEDWLDIDCLRECASEADAQISLESVRQALAKIPGSLTTDFVEERDDR
jgi:predicted DNA-binding antitoxin AbrB/MazE fold protein